MTKRLICLVAVQQCGEVLQFVEKQTSEICLAAVQENSFALEYVKEQTPELCLVAVQQLKYIKNQIE